VLGAFTLSTTQCVGCQEERTDGYGVASSGNGTVHGPALDGAPCVSVEWQRVDVPMEPFLDGSGLTRIPSCSGGPVKGEDGWVPGDRGFFLVRPSDASRLVIALDGGGACWNATTCVDSPLAENGPYEAEINESVSYLVKTSGIGDESEPANLFRDFGVST